MGLGMVLINGLELTKDIFYDGSVLYWPGVLLRYPRSGAILAGDWHQRHCYWTTRGTDSRPRSLNRKFPVYNRYRGRDFSDQPLYVPLS